MVGPMPSPTAGIPLDPTALDLLVQAVEAADDPGALAVLTDHLLEHGDATGLAIGRWLALSSAARLPADERDTWMRLKRSAARHLLGAVDRVLESQGRFYRRGLLIGAQLYVQHPAHLEPVLDHVMWQTVEALDLPWAGSRSMMGAELVTKTRTLTRLKALAIGHAKLLGVLVQSPALPLTALTLEDLPSHLAGVLADPSTFPALQSVRLRRVPADGLLFQRPFTQLRFDVSPKDAARAWRLARSASVETVEIAYGRAILSYDAGDSVWSVADESHPWNWQHASLASAMGVEVRRV
jgi:hypothetical protein